MSFAHHQQRDFSTNHRLFMLSAIAAVLGLLGTGAAWLLLAAIHFFTNLFFFQTFSLADRSPAVHTLGPWVILLPVIGGLLVGALAKLGSDKIRGHGIPEAIEAILYRKSLLSPKVALLKPLASGITIGSGGPFGAEGPIIMTGGAIGSIIAQLFSLSAGERKTLLVAGATAGMTAVFGTPLAAVLLAVELLLFEWRPRSLLPVIIACTVAGFARPFIIDAGLMFPLHSIAAGYATLPISILCGVLCGLAAAFLSTALYRIEDGFAKLPLHWAWWPALGGLVVGIGGYIEPRALGVGYDVIADLLNNRMLLTAVIVLVGVKAVIWTISLASGTSGGVLAPLLMMGAGLGALVAHFLPGAGIPLWPLVCMAAIFAGALGVPLTATIFAVELSGDFNAILPLLVACGIAHGLTVLVMRRSIMTEKIARRGLHIHREYSVDPHERVIVHEVMSSSATCIDGRLQLADIQTRYFGSEQQFRHYPVIQDGRLLGTLDRNSLQHAIREKGAALTASVLFGNAEPVFALANESCQTAARRMAMHDLQCLAVVGDAATRHVIGIVSRSDLVKPSHTGFHEEDVRESMWDQAKNGL